MRFLDLTRETGVRDKAPCVSAGNDYRQEIKALEESDSLSFTNGCRPLSRAEN